MSTTHSGEEILEEQGLVDTQQPWPVVQNTARQSFAVSCLVGLGTRMALFRACGNTLLQGRGMGPGARQTPKGQESNFPKSG